MSQNMGGGFEFYCDGIHYYGDEARAKLREAIEANEDKKRRLAKQRDRRLYWITASGILTLMIGLGFVGLGQVTTVHREAYWIGVAYGLVSQVVCYAISKLLIARVERSFPIG